MDPEPDCKPEDEIKSDTSDDDDGPLLGGMGDDGVAKIQFALDEAASLCEQFGVEDPVLTLSIIGSGGLPGTIPSLVPLHSYHHIL